MEISKENYLTVGNFVILIGLSFYQYNQNKLLKNKLIELEDKFENLNKEIEKQHNAVIQLSNAIKNSQNLYNNKIINIETDVGDIKKEIGTYDEPKRKRKRKNKVEKPITTKKVKNNDLENLLSNIP